MPLWGFHKEMNRKILCVDDEESILRGFTLHLSRVFELFTATNGAEGLKTFEEEGPFAVVVSDMRMPGMDGASMLSKIKELAPQTSTVLLTGHADFEFGGAAALGSGKLFRILTKPCSPDKLKNAIEEGISQYDSQTDES